MQRNEVSRSGACYVVSSFIQYDIGQGIQSLAFEGMRGYMFIVAGKGLKFALHMAYMDRSSVIGTARVSRFSIRLRCQGTQRQKCRV